MALTEAGARDFKIFATDIDQRALDVARRGFYPPAIREELSPERLARFFVATDGGYRVIDALRDAIVFAEQNLVADPAFSRLDLISCRNLRIYLEPELQRKVLSLFPFALKPGGALFLGTSETTSAQEALFKPLSKKWRIYRRVAGRSSADYPIGAWEPARFPQGRPDAEPAAGPPNLPSLVQGELLSSFTPAAVAVDARLAVLYFHGPVGEFLSFPTGKSTLDLVSMCPTAVRHKLRRAIAASREARDAHAFDVAWTGQRPQALVRVTAKPLAGELSLITFEHVAAAGPAADGQSDSEGGLGRVEQLESELRLLQDELKSTTDEMETSTEELKASNEEMMSMNEELQSTNEELETTKEELQSLNEELTTVNQQLNEKVVALEEANNDLINYLASTDTATIFLDLQLRIKRFTPVTRKLLNVMPGDVGRPLIELARKVEDTSMLSDAALVIENLAPIEKEVQTPSHQWFLRRIIPYRTHDHRIAGVVITFTDIMHMKHNESLKVQEMLRRHIVELEARATELAEANQQLTALERLKVDFINAASHELRTPLSSVLGFAEFLEDRLGGPLTEQQAEFVSEILRGGRRLNRLVDDLLDFARLEAGTFTLDRRDTELGALASAALKSLQPQARQAELTLEARLPDAPLYAPVDPDRVEQVLLNLIGNAIKFTPPGGHVTVRLAATPSGVCFEVADDGIGIGPETLPHLFQKFFQADASATRAQGGTGLGLAISKAFIEAHGGHIWVESTLGHGATFWFELPIATEKKSLAHV
jgi:two-component system CheB/CheR fusion protein